MQKKPRYIRIFMYFMPYVNSANSRLQKNNNNTNNKNKNKKVQFCKYACQFAECY